MYRIGREEIEEITKVIETRSMFKINSGMQETFKVEEKLRRVFGTEYSIFMTNGQAALETALISMGIGPGDQVIVPAYTYISTAMAVVNAGAIPVIADIDETLTLSPEDFERKITHATKAVMPVHIQGFPCNMDAICKIADKHGIKILEDACQADGGSYNGKRLGTFGDAGAFSFNFFKIISSGEGGALVTNKREIYEPALIYHDSSAVAFFGNQMQEFNTKTFCGSEYRANELCAAIMNIQLDRLDPLLADLRRNKAYMMDKLSKFVEIAPSNDIKGDCGMVIPLRFETAERSERVGSELRLLRPINTGRHIYRHWDPIMEKRGAFNPLKDPFKMEANRDIIPDYKPDMCLKTLDLLDKIVYANVDPDADEKTLDAEIERIKKAVLA